MCVCVCQYTFLNKQDKANGEQEQEDAVGVFGVGVVCWCG